MPYYPRHRDIDEGPNVSFYIDYSTVMCDGFGQEENTIVKAGSYTASPPTISPSKNPSPLQWVAVGKGGKVASVKTVRSHVSKGYHQRKRDLQKADLEKLTWQRRVELRPNTTPDDSPEPNTNIKSSGSNEASEDEWVLSTPIEKSQPSPSLSPTSIIQYQENRKLSLKLYMWVLKVRAR